MHFALPFRTRNLFLLALFFTLSLTPPTLAQAGQRGSVTVAVDLTAILQGAYAPSGSVLMRTDLLAGLLLPSASPYDAAPWSCPNATGGGPPPPPPPPTVVDWVLVELSMGDPANPPLTRAGCTAALLLSDGSVVSRSGGGPVTIVVGSAGSYYVALYHRNHIPVRSATPLDASSGTIVLDFTQPNAAYGTAPQAQVATGVYALWAGDGNNDEQVTAPDFNLYSSATAAGATGYTGADYNLDGQVTAPDFNLYSSSTAAGASSSFMLVKDPFGAHAMFPSSK